MRAYQYTPGGGSFNLGHPRLTTSPLQPASYKKGSEQLFLNDKPRRGPGSGDSLALATALATLQDPKHLARFWAKVVKLNGENACWIWTSALNRQGYGQFWVGTLKRAFPAHRLAFALAGGDVPDGFCVCHHCDNPICVRPHHLFAGTTSDNQKDRVGKGRWRNPNPRVRL